MSIEFPPSRAEPRSSFRLPLLMLLLLLGVLFWRFREARESPLHDPSAVPHAVTARGDLAADEKATIELYRSATPSVVFITRLELRRDRFSFNLFEIPKGEGSGFLWDDQGHVVTNYHVVEGTEGTEIHAEVTLSDQSTWKAVLVGTAPERDLAVLRIDAPKDRIRPILVGQSANLQVGQKVFAIGNPFGFDQTLTTGVISGLDREIQEQQGQRVIKGLIQTDAAINPGNSGGPLLDSAGRLIGVNTAILSPSGVYSGVGLAVPVDTVNEVVPQLIRHGKVVRPALGVSLAPDQVLRRFGKTGALVVDIASGTGADRAGIRPTRRRADGGVALGDIIVAIDAEPVRSSGDVSYILEKRKAGDEVKVTLERDGAKVEIKATLQELP